MVQSEQNSRRPGGVPALPTSREYHHDWHLRSTKAIWLRYMVASLRQVNTNPRVELLLDVLNWVERAQSLEELPPSEFFARLLTAIYADTPVNVIEKEIARDTVRTTPRPDEGQDE